MLYLILSAAVKKIHAFNNYWYLLCRFIFTPCITHSLLTRNSILSKDLRLPGFQQGIGAPEHKQSRNNWLHIVHLFLVHAKTPKQNARQMQRAVCKKLEPKGVLRHQTKGKRDTGPRSCIIGTETSCWIQLCGSFYLVMGLSCSSFK